MRISGSAVSSLLAFLLLLTACLLTLAMTLPSSRPRPTAAAPPALPPPPGSHFLHMSPRPHQVEVVPGDIPNEVQFKRTFNFSTPVVSEPTDVCFTILPCRHSVTFDITIAKLEQPLADVKEMNETKWQERGLQTTFSALGQSNVTVCQTMSRAVSQTWFSLRLATDSPLVELVDIYFTEGTPQFDTTLPTPEYHGPDMTLSYTDVLQQDSQIFCALFTRSHNPWQRCFIRNYFQRLPASKLHQMSQYNTAITVINFEDHYNYTGSCSFHTEQNIAYLENGVSYLMGVVSLVNRSGEMHFLNYPISQITAVTKSEIHESVARPSQSLQRALAAYETWVVSYTPGETISRLHLAVFVDSPPAEDPLVISVLSVSDSGAKERIAVRRLSSSYVYLRKSVNCSRVEIEFSHRNQSATINITIALSDDESTLQLPVLPRFEEGDLQLRHARVRGEAQSLDWLLLGDTRAGVQFEYRVSVFRQHDAATLSQDTLEARLLLEEVSGYLVEKESEEADMYRGSVEVSVMGFRGAACLNVNSLVPDSTYVVEISARRRRSQDFWITYNPAVLQS